MLRALVNHNDRFLEENYRLKAQMEIYAKKMGRKKAKLENERMVSRMRKADYEDVFRKLWDKTFEMDKPRSKIKTGLIPRLKLGTRISGTYSEMGTGCSSGSLTATI
ncbi:hypothetical protein L6452_36142 [Arctium lappa]|uniref:Uncharacterized protein n=1 Tax=Arctium lappa TaxID=4217 RepID=A0ACB8Y7R5_ARCLA|nr:hypothetical protein L6452_36142 [Arctium lappa]